MKKKGLLVLLILLVSITVFTAVGLTRPMKLTEYTFSSTELPQRLDGYRIAVISDLHNKRFGNGQQQLLDAIKSTSPDLICLTGDVICGDDLDFSPVDELLNGLAGMRIAYVDGNNEQESPLYDTFIALLQSHGVTVLDGYKQVSFALDEGEDSPLVSGFPFVDQRNLLGKVPPADESRINIMLYHDPACFDQLASLDYDLVLSGHTHGGVVRLPLIGSPLELLGMEKYVYGEYNEYAATLIVSSGLGDMEESPRFYNPPELVMVTLKRSAD